MREIWLDVLDAFGAVLRVFHDLTVGLFGGYSWIIAIILLTVAVRVLLLPLAVKQFRSMQAMQSLRPQMKRIQQRYKTDRGMMRTDPEKYRAQRQKQQEELMALYKEHNVNPASSCLPLIAQAPIFIALFSVLRSPDVIPELVDAPFVGAATLQTPANEAGFVALLMLVAMGFTTFVQQKQMMGRTAAMADDQQMQQQKMMLYVMPVFLAVLGFNLPVGILVYWVTTNLWQMGQQWFMLREVEHTAPPAKGGSSASTSKSTKRPGGTTSTGKSSGKSGSSRKTSSNDQPRGKKGGPAGGAKQSGRAKSDDNAKSDKAKSNGSSGKDASSNGHHSDGPQNISKQQGETGDKRR